MAHGLRGFSVMGGKRGGEDWLALCQGSEGSGMARVGERCGPQGHAPTALLPYLGPTSSFLPPHQDSLSSPVYQLVASQASATQETVQTPHSRSSTFTLQH